MTDSPAVRAVKQAIPTMVPSLAPWGVYAAHWLPDLDGAPALWLTVGTERQRAALEGAPWLSAQVALLLARQGMPYAAQRLRILVESAEGHAHLLAESGEI